MYQAERFHGVTLQTAKDEYVQEIGKPSSCEVRLSAEDTETSDYDRITVKQMFLPLVLFVTCGILAIMSQLCKLLLDCLGCLSNIWHDV